MKCIQCKYFMEDIRDVSCCGNALQEVNYYCCFSDQLIRTKETMPACNRFKESQNE